jgi:hypothetical protein
MAGCGQLELQSRQKDRDITIDGDVSDWKGALEFVEDGGFSIGLMNDDENLYVAIVGADREVERQIMLSGLYVWFDENGKQAKNFGVHYPIGLRETEGSPMPPRVRPDSLMTLFIDSTRELMLFSPKDGSWQRARTGTLVDVDAAAGQENYALALELKIPLARHDTGGFGVGAQPGDVVGLGLETPEIKIEQPERQHRPPEGGPGGGVGGGMPGIGGGGPPGMGGPGDEGKERPSPPKAMKLWVKVALSAGPAEHAR